MSSKSAGWPAYPGQWQNGDKSGFAPGMDRDTFIFSTVLAGILANPGAPIGSPAECIRVARKLTDLAHEDLTKAFQSRRPDSAPSDSGGSGWGK